MPAQAADEFPQTVEVVVEIPAGSRNKYDFDEATGVIGLEPLRSDRGRWHAEARA